MRNKTLFQRQYFVYIMASLTKVLYVGVTNNIIRRTQEHREGLIEGFTKRYNVKRLVYYEEGGDIHEVITREKQIKGWMRYKKIALIEEVNPDWEDLYTQL